MSTFLCYEKFPVNLIWIYAFGIEGLSNLRYHVCVDKIGSRPRRILCVGKIGSRPRGILCVDKIQSQTPILHSSLFKVRIPLFDQILTSRANPWTRRDYRLSRSPPCPRKNNSVQNVPRHKDLRRSEARRHSPAGGKLESDTNSRFHSQLLTLAKRVLKPQDKNLLGKKNPI